MKIINNSKSQLSIFHQPSIYKSDVLITDVAAKAVVIINIILVFVTADVVVVVVVGYLIHLICQKNHNGSNWRTIVIDLSL